MAKDKDTLTFGTPVEGINQLLAIGLDDDLRESSTPIYDIFMTYGNDMHQVDAQRVSINRKPSLGRYIITLDNAIAIGTKKDLVEARTKIKSYLEKQSEQPQAKKIMDKISPLLKKLNPQSK
jgi:hypothetical protein